MAILKFSFVILVFALIVISGCASNKASSEKPTQTTALNTPEKQPQAMVEKTTEGSQKTATEVKYSGTVLGGKSAPFIDFNKADYDTAVGTDKLVVLYFYANWCPICKVEIPQAYSAFNELSTDKVIGFRVNFNDDQTGQDEKDIARQFGVPYQHTKVFVKGGKSVLKSLDQWDKAKYLLEINKAVA